MDTKFLSYTGLQEYDDLIKAYVDTGLSGKSGSTHTHDGRYYTETEIDTKLSGINTNIDKITSGDTVVKKAETADTATSATSATYATTATKAGTADKATTASKAGTASKLGTSTVGSATQPIYLNAGSATTCTKYAGGTKVTLNGSAKGGADASFFAPTTGGTAGYILKSAGTASAPVWEALETVDAYTKAEVDTKLSGKSDTSHNHDSKYDAKGASTAALESAKTYTNTKVAGLATTAVVDSKISTHNASTTSHSDIRATLAAVKEDVDAFFKDATISTEAKDTLKEIQEYITSDVEAAAAMTASINNKSDKGHGHEIADVSGLQSALDGKAASSHGTHVTWSTTSPKMNGTAAVGSETKVARGDHVHPTDTSRAAKSDFDTHVASTVSHVTADERTAWNAKASTANATTKTAGLMSSADKTKLDGIAEGANKYTHPTTSGNKHIPSGGASGQILRWSSDGTAVWGADNNTTYSNATTATAGLVKSGSTVTSTSGLTAVPIINGVPYYKNTTYSNATSATAGLVKVDTALSSSSTNPVQNKAVNTAITSLTSSVAANTSSITTLTNALAGFAEITSAEIQALFA